MIGTLSKIPFYQYEVKDWHNKKKQIVEAIGDVVYTRPNLIKGMGDFETDRDSPREYLDDFMRIFNEELQQFGREIEVNQFKITDMWSVQYKNGDHHPVHTHGRTNLSGVLYLDYDYNEHTGTNFVVGSVNTFTNMTDIISPFVKEGDLFIFPSSLLHFTLPNKSDKIRKIISFDISITGWQ